MCRSVVPLAALFCCLLLAGSSWASEKDSTQPCTKGGRKWRIGYLEGGYYSNYEALLLKLYAGLMELGWVQPAAIPKPRDEGGTRPVWEWMGRPGASDYLEFVQDAHWSCGWDEKKRAGLKAEILERLQTRRDIDLMIAMGTWAGQDLANDRHSVPTVVMSVSNALQAGIIASNEDSGLDHLHARVSPKRYERQIRLFHQAVGFRKLGVAYKDTSAGRAYAALEDIDRVAAELHFEVVKCPAVSHPDLEVVEESLVKCHETLAPQVDAVYLPAQTGSEGKNLSRLLETLYRHKVRSFAQRSSREVRQGVMMSLTDEITDALGLFEAAVMVGILKGAKPRSLPMFFDDETNKFAINMAVAKMVDYDPPDWVMEMADEVYLKIEAP